MQMPPAASSARFLAIVVPTTVRVPRFPRAAPSSVASLFVKTQSVMVIAPALKTAAPLEAFPLMNLSPLLDTVVPCAPTNTRPLRLALIVRRTGPGPRMSRSSVISICPKTRRIV